MEMSLKNTVKLHPSKLRYPFMLYKWLQELSIEPKEENR